MVGIDELAVNPESTVFDEFDSIFEANEDTVQPFSIDYGDINFSYVVLELDLEFNCGIDETLFNLDDLNA